MKELQTCAAEALQSPSTVSSQHAVLSSIVQIAQNFSDDMNILRKAVRLDASPTLAEKIDFIFRKKSLRNILQRLERRKTAAIVAISIRSTPPYNPPPSRSTPAPRFARHPYYRSFAYFLSILWTTKKINISSESSFSTLSETAVLSTQLRNVKAMGQCYAGNL
jgi:hypothetical protein